MPLDGNHETAGDTILNNSEKFILVEFKKEFTNIKDEQKKFGKSLTKIPDEINKLKLNSLKFHKLIYGELNKQQFNLMEIEYWKGVINNNSKGTILNRNFTNDGIEYEKFKEYVKTFIGLKKSSTTTTGSGGFSYLYSNVLGIDSKGNINQVVSLQEFAQQILKMELKPKKDISNSNKLSGPKM